jgi:acyl carrier protein
MGAPFLAGLPIDCKARIANSAAEGELELHGKNVFPGYWKNKARTLASFTEDGWFKTGDIARQNDDGSFEILGRIKTVIMTGGVLIRPDEIDEALLRHPSVLESVTVGVQDEIFGEVGMTGVVLDGEADEVALTHHLRQYIEPRKIPKRIIFLDHIPRGVSGKAKIVELTDLLGKSASSVQNDTHDKSIAKMVLTIAAKVFRVPIEQLSLRTRPNDVEGWDSFTQLNLVLSIEDKIERQIPASRVSALQQLGDFVDAIRDTE